MLLNQPAGPTIRTIGEVGLWQRPWILGNLPLVGPILNVLYNFYWQRLTYKSVGAFLADNLHSDVELRGKRIGLLEDSTKTKL